MFHKKKRIQSQQIYQKQHEHCTIQMFSIAHINVQITDALPYGKVLSIAKQVKMKSLSKHIIRHFLEHRGDFPILRLSHIPSLCVIKLAVRYNKIDLIKLQKLTLKLDTTQILIHFVYNAHQRRIQKPVEHLRQSFL